MLVSELRNGSLYIYIYVYRLTSMNINKISNLIEDLVTYICIHILVYISICTKGTYVCTKSTIISKIITIKPEFILKMWTN